MPEMDRWHFDRERVVDASGLAWTFRVLARTRVDRQQLHAVLAQRPLESASFLGEPLPLTILNPPVTHSQSSRVHTPDQGWIADHESVGVG
jgi:hypothetical protein